MIDFIDIKGPAGESHILLMGRMNGIEHSEFYTGFAWYSEWSRNRAMKKIIRRFYRAKNSW